MKTVRIGARRLYDSMGCSIINQQPFNLVFPFGDHLQAEIYMGNKPKFGITVETEHDDYIIPGAQMRLGSYAYHADATQSAYPRTFFTEIICSQEEEISDELFAAFYRNDQEASQELLKRAATHTEDFKIVMDFLCGVLGLRFHPQFIQELLNENFIAFHNEQQAYTHSGSAAQVLDSVQLNEIGMGIISHMFPELGKVEVEAAQKIGQILGWLIRAWSERDIIAKFNALFIPLEMILDGVSGTLSVDFSSHIQALQDFIQAQGGEETERLTHSLEELTKKIRPSLIDRFNVFAGEAKMPGWENDKTAFKKFNRLRNNLLHRGDPNVRIHVSVGEVKEEIQALEDLTERYVNFYLFGDTTVYQSSFLSRPKPPTS
jgi:hypothetical protein